MFRLSLEIFLSGHYFKESVFPVTAKEVFFEKMKPEIPPFTWSMRRREMLLRCPWEYYCHYCGSAGGAFIGENDVENERLHLLRNAASTQEYVRRIIFSRIRELFNSGASAAGNFCSDLEEIFRREFRDMLWGKPASDHKRSLLSALTLRNAQPQALAENVTALLRREAALLLPETLPFLFSVPVDARILLAYPLKVCWNNLDCYVTPVAAWLDDRGFSFVCAGKESEENSALLCFYALTQFNIPPEKVNIFHLVEGKLESAAKLLSASAPFRRIRKDADEMLLLDLKLKNTKVPEWLFPRSMSHCSDCRFASFCTEEI